ncbi:MAG: dienelactone hydrolase family protein [Burkholderiales bacterium]
MSVTFERAVRVPAGGVRLEGDLSVPENAYGAVLFAIAGGNGRYNARYRFLVRLFNKFRLATLLIDLVTTEEEKHDLLSANVRADAGTLAERLSSVTDWLAAHPDVRNLTIGYFGANTGAAAAFSAAVLRADLIGAIVSCDGRPDLATEDLRQVRAPTLLIVGARDLDLAGVNEAALAQMECERDLVIMSGVAHVLEETASLQHVGRLAREWFLRHLAPSPGEVRRVEANPHLA